MLFDNYDFDTYMAVIREGGREEEREEIARNALAEGASIEFVQKITRLDQVAVNRLQKNTARS